MTNIRHNGPFRFMDLPAELRGEIYKHKISGKDLSRFEAKNIRLLSRKVKEEIDDEILMVTRGQVHSFMLKMGIKMMPRDITLQGHARGHPEMLLQPMSAFMELAFMPDTYATCVSFRFSINALDKFSGNIASDIWSGLPSIVKTVTLEIHFPEWEPSES